MVVILLLHSIFNPGNLAILAIQQSGNANAGMLECLECQNAWNAGMWCRNVPKMNSGGTPYTHISLQAAYIFNISNLDLYINI